MNIHLSKQLLHWNSLYQQLNEIYRQYATQKGVSETTLWLLYFLCEHGGSCEQRALCRSLLDPPQTVNSSLKKLEQLQMLTLMQKHQDLLRMELERAACIDPEEEQHV